MSRFNFDNQVSENAVEYGMQNLNDAEVLALAIGLPIKTSREILMELDRDVTKLKKMTLEELRSIKGIGKARAIRIKSVLGFVNRVNHVVRSDRRITCSQDSFQLMKPYFSTIDHEHFYVLALSRSNKVMGIKQISSGGMAGTVVDKKIVFKYLLSVKASSFICLHNHPSGNLRPSQADIGLTGEIAKAGRLLDIILLDHVIMADEFYYSFADEGML